MKEEKDFQGEVCKWVVECFGQEAMTSVQVRSEKFLEEAVEMVQSTGLSKEACLKMVDHVYSRAPGEPFQEMGGVMITAFSLAGCLGFDAEFCGQRELDRIWAHIEEVRERDKSKPKFHLQD